MSIKVGDKLPEVTFKQFTSEGMKEVNTKDLFAGKKIVLFGVPGAFTPTCSKTHLPGYVEKADEIKSKGVDAIYCLSVNDPFVMSEWGQQHKVEGKVAMLADGNCEFTKATGLELDGRGAGLGTRCKRFSLVAENGVVKSLNVEEVASKVEVSGAGTCLVNLG